MMTLEQAHQQQGEYVARAEFRNKLNRTDLVAFVGATAVGKNFMLDASGYPVTHTETTRGYRAGDNKQLYTYATNTQMLEAISAGELIQYGVALPHTIYGSRLRDYTLDTPNVTDIWFDAVESLKNKGFRSVKAVSILAPKQQWQDRLKVRTKDMSVGDVISRLSYDRHSIKWSIANHLYGSPDHLSIINDVAMTHENIEKIRMFIEGEKVDPLDDDKVIHAGHDMLAVIDQQIRTFDGNSFRV